MILPTIAIIGRPNVGKSTLVNRLCQSNDAIVFDKHGVTRDRTYKNASWGGKEFQVVDSHLLTATIVLQFEFLNHFAIDKSPSVTP